MIRQRFTGRVHFCGLRWKYSREYNPETTKACYTNCVNYALIDSSVALYNNVLLKDVEIVW